MTVPEPLSVIEKWQRLLAKYGTLTFESVLLLLERTEIALAQEREVRRRLRKALTESAGLHHLMGGQQDPRRVLQLLDELERELLGEEEK